jgi:ribosomal protein S18 acetylase RimI-like enzyme
MGTIKKYTFRVLLSSELEDGYEILCEASKWLNSRGIRQLIRPLPKEIYKKWHEKNQNFGLFFKDDLAVVLSLVREKADKWKGFIPEKNPMWLSSIATAMKYKGRQFGKLAVKEAIKYLKKQKIEKIYLGYVFGNEFLTRFYEKMGFKRISRKELEFPTGLFDMVLMSKELI